MTAETRPVARAGRPPMPEPLVEMIEGCAFEASAELVHQRADLEAAASDANNRALRDALRVDGLPSLARELIRTALAAEDAEDAAIRRAEDRRSLAHGYTRRIPTVIELHETGRCRGREVASGPTAAEQMPLEGI